MEGVNKFPSTTTPKMPVRMKYPISFLSVFDHFDRMTIRFDRMIMIPVVLVNINPVGLKKKILLF